MRPFVLSSTHIDRQQVREHAFRRQRQRDLAPAHQLPGERNVDLVEADIISLGARVEHGHIDSADPRRDPG